MNRAQMPQTMTIGLGIGDRRSPRVRPRPPSRRPQLDRRGNHAPRHDEALPSLRRRHRCHGGGSSLSLDRETLASHRQRRCVLRCGIAPLSTARSKLMIYSASVAAGRSRLRRSAWSTPTGTVVERGNTDVGAQYGTDEGRRLAPWLCACLALLAVGLFSACDPSNVGRVGQTANDGERPSSRPVDADGGTHNGAAIDDGGTRADGGPIDGGTAEGLVCVTEGAERSLPCEPDADFCEGPDDVDYHPTKDFVAGWARNEGDTFVVQLVFAAPVFTGATGAATYHPLYLYLREHGAARDMGLQCRETPFDPAESASYLVEVIHDVQYVPTMVTACSAYPFSPECCDGCNCCVDLDVCQAIYVSKDGYMLEIRVPTTVPVESWWVQTSHNIQCDEPDGASSIGFLPVGGGAYDGVATSAICAGVCPVTE